LLSLLFALGRSKETKWTGNELHTSASDPRYDNDLLNDSISIKKEDTESLLDASKTVGTKAKAEKTKYMFTSRYLTTGQNH
jgi:hypothetical protein